MDAVEGGHPKISFRMIDAVVVSSVVEADVKAPLAVPVGDAFIDALGPLFFAAHEDDDLVSICEVLSVLWVTYHAEPLAKEKAPLQNTTELTTTNHSVSIINLSLILIQIFF
jgi:hypothetical protein